MATKKKFGASSVRDSVINAGQLTPEEQEQLNSSAQEDSLFTNPNGSVYNVFDGSGQTRHSGIFSKNNPYYNQLAFATNNADKDALYAQAVEWEANNRDYQIQLETNKAILDEQRAYDDPSSRIARDRAAGINPDIAGSSGGSSGGSSSAQMSVPQMADADANVTYSNKYDNTRLVFEGLSSAANLLSSVTSFGQGVVGCFDMLKTLPGRVSLMDSQTNLANKQADFANAQTNQVSEQTVQTRVNTLGNLSQMFTDESSDDDINATLTALGYAPDDIDSTRDSIRTFQKNPKMREMFDTNRHNALRAEQKFQKYTPEIIGRIMSFSAQFEQSSAQFQADSALVQSKIQSYLVNSSYSADTASAISQGAVVDREKAELAYKEVERDISAYVQNVADIKDTIKQSEALVSDITKASKARGYLTSAEEAIIDAELIKQSQLRALGSNQLSNVYSMARSTAKNRYNADALLSDDGNPLMNVLVERHHTFRDFTFDDMVTNNTSAESVISNLMSLIPKIGFHSGKSTATIIKK